MKLAGLHHLAIICSNYPVSRRFYTERLGLRVISETHRPERDSWKLDLEIPGGGQIELFSFPESPVRPSYPEACGLRHLAFRVQNLDRETAELTQNGISVEESRVDMLTGKRFTFFADPDGLPIELYEE
jgi:glyoxylase I family protein